MKSKSDGWQPIRVIQLSATLVILLLGLIGTPQTATAFYCEFQMDCTLTAEDCVEHLHDPCGDGCGLIYCEPEGLEDWFCPDPYEVAMICSSERGIH